jgi:DNA primase
MYHDFGTGFHENFVGVVMEIHKCSYQEALNVIAEDFGYISKAEDRPAVKIKVSNVKLEEKTETLIQIKPKAFSEQELKWWKGFGVTEKTLKKYKVFSCDSIFLNGDYFSSSSPRVPIYGYYCGKKNGQELWRIYFPSKRSFRFLSNVGKSYIQGAKQLPKTGDVLLITKSQKDVMLAYELGIPAIAPCSEVLFLSNKQIQHLKKRFKTIVVCYDTDITGIHNLKQIKVKHPDLHTFFIPRKYGVKDISDFFKKYGEEETKRLAGELLKYYRSLSDRKEE